MFIRGKRIVCVQGFGVNMASQEEDNKLETISNVNKEQERYYLNVYKKYESILNDKTEKFENKVQSLIEVWKSISELNFAQFDIRYIIQIIDWAKLHALNVVLTGEWRATKESFRDSLLQCIEKAQSSLASVNDAFSTRCQKLANVVKKPWEDPVLYNLIQEKDAEIGSKEMEFFCVETAYLVSVRLKKLCENHCEDLALNLVTNFLKYKKQATVQNFNLNATETQLWFIFDIYIALLYKFQDKKKILEQFEDLQLEEGTQLIRRFAKKRVKISKIWRNCHKIAIFGCRFFMSKALMKYNSDFKELLTNLLKTYLALSNTDLLLQEFVVSVRNLTNLADAEGLCVMCENIHREAASKLRHFAIEMYIRALTTDMNELERLKHVNEEEKMKLTTSRLANTFSNLAELLDDHVKVARECVLTAFSLEPTTERLRQIEDLAKRSGFPVLDTGQEWKCRLHPPVLPSDDVAWVCTECGEWMCKPELTAPLQMNTPLQDALQESVLGISEALCDDLVVCLSNPRYHILSWLLSWDDLYRLCILYLNDPEKTKNFVTELKFVDVDYSMFSHIKREPVDEYTGIEKGYEQYLDLDFVSDEETSSVSEDSTSHDRCVGLGSDGTEESFLPRPQPTSDPNTLKSLRMFRPNLKRKKDESEVPAKGKKIVFSTPNNSSFSSERFESQTANPLSSKPGVSNEYPLDIVYGPRFAGTSLNAPHQTLKLNYKSDNRQDHKFSLKAAKSSSSNTSPAIPSKKTFGSMSQSELASAILQPRNSVFNSTTLSSVTSTDYVANIIKSKLAFGVSRISPEIILPLPRNERSNDLKKTGAFVAPSAVAKKNSTPASSKQHGIFISPSTIVQKSAKTIQKGNVSATSSSKVKSPQVKNPKPPVSSSLVTDLDALLKEVVEDIDADANQMNVTDSKNGVAATLPQLGGQVASNYKQLIQVPHQPSSSHIQTQSKLLPKMSSPIGTKDVCKTKLRKKRPKEKKLREKKLREKKLRENKLRVKRLRERKLREKMLRDKKLKDKRAEKDSHHGQTSELTQKKMQKDNNITTSPGNVMYKAMEFSKESMHANLVTQQAMKVKEIKVRSGSSSIQENSTVQKAPKLLTATPKPKSVIIQADQVTALPPRPATPRQYKAQENIRKVEKLLKSLSLGGPPISNFPIWPTPPSRQPPSQTVAATVPTRQKTKEKVPQNSPTSRYRKERYSSHLETVQVVNQSRCSEFPPRQVVTVSQPLQAEKINLASQKKATDLCLQRCPTLRVYKAAMKRSNQHETRLMSKQNKGEIPNIAESKTPQEDWSVLRRKMPTYPNYSPMPALAATVGCDKGKVQNANKKTERVLSETMQDAFKELIKTEQHYASIEGNLFTRIQGRDDIQAKGQVSDKLGKSRLHNVSEQSVDEIAMENVNKTLDCDNNGEIDLHNVNGCERLDELTEWFEDAVMCDTKDEHQISRENTDIDIKIENPISTTSNIGCSIAKQRKMYTNRKKLVDQIGAIKKQDCTNNLIQRLTPISEIDTTIILEEEVTFECFKNEISEESHVSTVAEIKFNLKETIEIQKMVKEIVIQIQNIKEKHPINWQVLQFFENNTKELRILLDRSNFKKYINEYCHKSDDNSDIQDSADQCPIVTTTSTTTKIVKSTADVNKGNDRLLRNKGNPKVSPGNTACSRANAKREVDHCRTSGHLIGDRKHGNQGVKLYNTRKRKHDDAVGSKVEQEKAYRKFKIRRLEVVLTPLPEVISRPNVKVFVSSPFKNNEERADGDKCKKTSPLVDSNVRNETKKKADEYYIKNKTRKSRDESIDYGVDVYIYEDKFYRMTTRVFNTSLGRCGNNGPIKFLGIPGLDDFSEILPRNINYVVNVVQHSIPRSSSVANQNTQTSTQVTPHIQRIGQPKLPDRKPDHYENDSEQSPSSSNVHNMPSTSQSSSLLSVQSSPKPGQRSVQSRQAPYINILAQQIVKPTECPSDNGNTTVIKVETEDHAEGQITKTVNTNLRIVTTTTQAGATTTTSAPSQGGTILQFICKSSSLPKFQQAFGKTVYQTGSSGEGEPSGTSTNDSQNHSQTATVVETKKIAAKALPVNVQPITGNVIFRGQVPVGQTVSLIPPGSNTRQLFRITGSTHEQISLVKETVIQNKMSALLAAALQGKPKITEQNGELVEEYSATRITLCRPGSVPPNATRIVKPVQLQIPANVIRAPQPNVSSTTLEQLREFDMVYKQVKERSNNPAQSESSAQSSQEPPQQQRISFTYVNQVQKYTQLSPVVVVSNYNPVQQSISPSLSVTSQGGSATCLTQVSTVAVPKVAVKTSKGKSIKSPVVKTSPAAVPALPKPMQKPQEDEHTTQRIFDILAEYAEQLRNSPDLNNKPAPRRRSNPPTNPSSNSSSTSSSKKKKKKSCSSTTSNLVETDNEDLTMGSEDSSGGNVAQLSMTDEEQSQSASITPPESNLEPPSLNVSLPKPLIVTDSSSHSRNVIIADSSVGEALKIPNTALLMPGNYIMPVSVVKGGQQIAVVSGGSKILTTVPTRSGQNMLLFQSFINQNPKGGISAVKYSTLQPFSGISSQNLPGVNTQNPVVLPSNSVATVALGQPLTLKKIEDSDNGGNSELLLTISQHRDPIKVEKPSDFPQPDSSTNPSAIEVKIEASSTSDVPVNEVLTSIQKTNSVATSVIAAVIKKEERGTETSSRDPIVKADGSSKQGVRIDSVLVNTSTSNGPMLSHTNTRYRKPAERVETTTTTPKEFSPNPGKAPQLATKVFKNNTVYYAIRTKKAISKKIDSEMQKQAAMERELHLQKTLSEECEDLGVDEPSTSDLFPEADLLFDSNHSPSYDQSGHKNQGSGTKTKDSMHLFSDDENSEPMRNDLFDYVEYHPQESSVDQMNGTNTPNQSTSCDDSTLPPNCSSVSEVTLNSPISSEYSDSNHAVNKYKYKYTNRKKSEKVIKLQSESWHDVTEVTSSEQLVKEDKTPIEDAVIEDAVTEVGATIMDHPKNSDTDLSFRCPIHGPVEEKMSRKAAKKTCLCFNGARNPNVSSAKKRANSPKSHGPTPSKKLFPSKKR